MIFDMARKSRLDPPSIPLGDLTLGERIASFRKDQGYTQAKLAEKMGITQVLVSDYERERIRPHPEMLARFALAFGISIDQLVGLKESIIQQNDKEKNLLKKLRRALDLPTKDRSSLLNILDGLLAKNGLH